MADYDFTQAADESAREISPERLEYLLDIVKRESTFCGALARTAALSSHVDGEDWRRIFELIAEHSNLIETAFVCYRDGSPYPAY